MEIRSAVEPRDVRRRDGVAPRSVVSRRNEEFGRDEEEEEEDHNHSQGVCRRDGEEPLQRSTRNIFQNKR